MTNSFMEHYNDDFYKMHIPWQEDYLKVAKWINENINGEICGDIGCGNGYIIKNLFDYNKKVWGIDGSENFVEYVDKSILPYVKRIDLTNHIKLEKADIVICLEVAEHIPYEFSDIFIENIISTEADTILFTSAPPGQPGIGHINLQPYEFWIKKFKMKGYFLNKKLCSKFKSDLKGKLQYITWYLNNIMIFNKESANKINHSDNKTYHDRLKLVMTLLVRDENDIIRQNIDFHLNQGVDFIVATDNGSIDGTREILKDYEDNGILHLIDEKIQDYSQANWVNRMGKIAYEKYDADIIFHCDADEFWYSKSGNLKHEFTKSPDIDVLIVNLVNILLENKGGSESFPEDARYAVVKPFETVNLEKASENMNLYLFRYPPKVIFKTARGFFEVIQGNHAVIDKDNEIKKQVSKDIMIYHFPVRNKKHFFRKVENGGSAYLTNNKLDKGIGFHWRRWYELYRNGKLDKEYEKLTLKKEEAGRLLNTGVIKEYDSEDLILNKKRKKKNKYWKFYYPIFEYEESSQDLELPWAGHKYFAYDLIHNNRPKRVVELGTYMGTSFFSFCQAVKDLGIDTDLNAVDTWQGDKHAGFYSESVFYEVEKIKKTYYEDLKITLFKKTFDEALNDFEDSSIDLLHIDGCHTYEAVRHDFETWLPKMSQRGIVLFHDTNVYESDFGVWKFWEEIRQEYPHFEFLHSYGLGVLGAGKDQSKEIQELFFMSEKKFVTIRGIYHEIWQNQVFLAKFISEGQDRLLAEKDRLLAEKDRLLAEKDRLLAEYKHQILSLVNSRSWKLTAPLRNLVGMLRSLKR